MTDHPFFMWSIVEAWNWVAHLPALGFLALLLVAFLAFAMAMYLKDV
jgi:hypothetical protein